MPGLADLLYLGQPDPRRQLAMALQGQQQPQQPPQKPNAPTPDAQPVASDPRTGSSVTQNPAPGAAPPPNSPPQPAALQSTPDMSASYQQLANPPNLMSLYMQLDARDRASDQINRGFALIAANHSSPAMANAIMQSVGGGASAGQEVGDLMKIQQWQYGQQQLQAFEKSLPALSQQTGLSVETLRALGPQGMANIVERQQASKLPTDEQRNVQWEHDQFIKGGGDEATWQRDYLPMIISRGMAGASDPMFQVYMQERRQALAQDPNAIVPNYADWTAQRQAKAQGEKEAESNKQEAIKSFPLLQANLNKYLDNLGDIATDENLKNVTGHPVLDLSSLNEGGRGFNAKVASAQTLAKMLLNKGGALTASNLAGISSDAEALSKYSLNEEQYRSIVLEPQIKQALTAAANNYVAAGKTDQMPGYLRPYADQTAQLSPRVGVKANPKLKQLTEQDIADAQTNIEKHGPSYVLKFLKSEGYDTSPLE